MAPGGDILCLKWSMIYEPTEGTTALFFSFFLMDEDVFQVNKVKRWFLKATTEVINDIDSYWIRNTENIQLHRTGQI